MRKSTGNWTRRIAAGGLTRSEELCDPVCVQYLGMNLTTDMYDDYFYSYCMDLTSMGDMDTVIGGMLYVCSDAGEVGFVGMPHFSDRLARTHYSP